MKNEEMIFCEEVPMISNWKRFLLSFLPTKKIIGEGIEYHYKELWGRFYIINEKRR